MILAAFIKTYYSYLLSVQARHKVSIINKINFVDNVSIINKTNFIDNVSINYKINCINKVNIADLAYCSQQY